MRCASARIIATCALLSFVSAQAIEFHVTVGGSDTNEGSAIQPFATIARAQLAAREAKGRVPVTVIIHQGTYYLGRPLVFSTEDSGAPASPVVYQAAEGERVVLSGGARLHPEWVKNGAVQQASLSGEQPIDQLFIDNQRQRMARYPNYDPAVLPYGGHAADALSPARVSRWGAPAGGFIHAIHSAEWGGYHYRITGKDNNNALIYEGGWQNNRQMGMHPRYRFVENIKEELDAPGEWFHDLTEETIYFIPPPGINLSRAIVEVPRLRHLVEFIGTPESPVQHVILRGFVFRHALRTFMDVREPLLRSDWRIYRGGAVVFRGAKTCVLEDCEFDQVGGNAVFVDGWNRGVQLRGCDIHDAGGSAVAFVGDPKSVRNPLFEYHERQDLSTLDLTPGPKTHDYPAACLVENCLLRNFGVVEKQAAGVQISMSLAITVRHCSVYEGPRAGINISEGTFGGHVIEFCDVFDTVRETGDHGSFNSWGRDRFWGLTGASAEDLSALARLDMVKPNVLRNNRWRCDHGWDVDLDDGSSNYLIYNNLFLRGGLKLREGFHRHVFNNITVNNSLHPHVWFENSGDVVTNNIWMGAYRPAAMDPTLAKWGELVDFNLFAASENDRKQFVEKGCDTHSVVADPKFIDPALGDFRVEQESPALRLGFVNFPMDRFGVQIPKLKKRARQPHISALAYSRETVASTQFTWLEARVRDLTGEDYSAYGLPRDAGGVVVDQVPAGSVAERFGLRRSDIIQAVNTTKDPRAEVLARIEPAAIRTISVFRSQRPIVLRPGANP